MVSKLVKQEGKKREAEDISSVQFYFCAVLFLRILIFFFIKNGLSL